MSQIFFSSDYHFNHFNIIQYADRPFHNVQTMNDTIIKRHNERVKDNDKVYYLGDLGFHCSKQKEERGEGLNSSSLKLLSKMNGHIIRVAGNHDKPSNKNATPTHRIILRKGGIYINLVHRPEATLIEDELHYYPLTIHGHVHDRYKTKEIENGKIALCINVSVETNNYYPYTFDEIMGIYHRWVNAHPRKKEMRKWINTRKNS